MLPDNRIRYPAPLIDFAADVGTTGQDHDTYPAAGQQARFDHQRMALIGLLAQQASYSAPTQYRDGTPWFDLNVLALKIWRNGSWQFYSNAIPLAVNDDVVTTLQDWYDAVSPSLGQLSPEVVFGGTTTATTTSINIPESLRNYLTSDTRCFLFVDGVLVDPRNCALIGDPQPTTIVLSNVAMSAASEFIVSLRRVPAATYYTSNVTP